MTIHQSTEEIDLIAAIRKSPHLPHLLRQLNDAWEEEKKRRAEFYNWVTPDVKAEFIQGEIIVHSPVRSKHNLVLANVHALVRAFVLYRELGYVGIEKIMCEFPRNAYEPDMVFFDKETAATIDDETTVFPVPQFIVEVLSNSTEDRDRGVKYEDYEANGVKEYWIIDPYTDAVEQYSLVENRYELVKKFRNKEVISSKILDGFAIPVEAIFDEKANLSALRKIAEG